MGDPILKVHSDEMEKMDFPEWITEIECPFCKEQVDIRGIRNIQLCLNTRNFGEIAIEVFCDDCRKMDTLYFRTKIDNISDFVGCLRGQYGQYNVPPEPIVEESMYKMNYNNIMEIMAANSKKESKDDIV